MMPVLSLRKIHTEKNMNMELKPDALDRGFIRIAQGISMANYAVIEFLVQLVKEFAESRQQMEISVMEWCG